MLHHLATNLKYSTEKKEASRKGWSGIRSEKKSLSPVKSESWNPSSERIERLDNVYLIRLLYDGAIDYLARAQKASHRGDLAGKTRNIDRTLNIVHELSRSLKRNGQNELVESLEYLYLFWINSLNLAKDPESGQSLGSIIGMMNSVRAICLPKKAPVLSNVCAA
jgi:flagellar protein FliS